MVTKTVSLSEFIFISFLTFTFLSIQGCMSSRNRSIKNWEKYEWKIIKESENIKMGWKIYKRKIKGTNFLEYKIKGEIQASPNACIEIFNENLYKQALDHKKYPIYQISHESEDSILTYLVHKEPFPLKNTEMSVRYVIDTLEDNSANIIWKEAWEDCSKQPSKKLKRIESFRGSWHFLQINYSISLGVKSVRFDPKGMPRLLVEPMVFKFLQEGLEDIRKSSSN